MMYTQSIFLLNLSIKFHDITRIIVFKYY